MIEITGNVWKELGVADIILIPTNGFVKRNGKAVMGAGVALQALKRMPGIDVALGARILEHGNVISHVFNYVTNSNSQVPVVTEIWSFPVKHNWYENADIDLIRKSAKRLMEILDIYPWKADRVVLPKPGCGNGCLHWEFDVKPVIAGILDNRVFVIDRRSR